MLFQYVIFKSLPLVIETVIIEGLVDANILQMTPSECGQHHRSRAAFCVLSLQIHFPMIFSQFDIHTLQFVCSMNISHSDVGFQCRSSITGHLSATFYLISRCVPCCATAGIEDEVLKGNTEEWWRL